MAACAQDLDSLPDDPPPDSMIDPPRCHALVPCAGAGSRAAAGMAKQYVVIAGRTIVAHTLAALADVARLATVLVVLAPGDSTFKRVVATTASNVRTFDGGGESRALTVANGLDELLRLGAAADDWVLVHDAARCLVRAVSIDALIDACIDDAVGGLLALRLADTLKVERGSRVASTLTRVDKWLAQTPQMFRIGMLRDALREAGPDVTDEASAIEALGHAPLLVEGALENFKVTHASDFALAARLLETR